MAEYVRVAAADEIAPGDALVVAVEGRTIAVFNVGGTLYAVDDICTHEYASLSQGARNGEIVTCPKHGSRFDVRTGRVLSLPAVVPLNTYPVKVDDGQVYVLPVPQRGRGMPHKV
ncbi:MAG: non-heme iron oxygenase ferredoxin subunit [Armatimonadota bacterium]|nr:non-heme iron oxygenase ferredoxin subunit [Armatimonadota bacterium]MDR7451406.1 non-heme iron oxygenase ferredoxin subunit [Armatimonadota bacterium]MDR7466444.1 non-heme iron oxygenase ferredoxin subunit [Armatimonadota bacterium]MDR7493166.1 non-heme iron oxygenase ferredoxin subunit [Armatimonadota bacterium]MDR7500355.1 non-heme iron oxygenase ferredoxin subunit [Armatimonadota bacterium]